MLNNCDCGLTGGCKKCNENMQGIQFVPEPIPNLGKDKMNCDESVVIMSAIRYMLGRSSYGVGSVCDYVKNQKDRLTDSNKQVIERDILDYIKEFPDMSYKKDWLELIDNINK